MTEQVSVDADTVKEVIRHGETEVSIVPTKEYERLKRIDENVKKKIELIKSTVGKCEANGLSAFYIDKAILMVLESLYDEQ